VSLKRSVHFEGFTPFVSTSVRADADRSLRDNGLSALCDLWEINVSHDAPHHNAYRAATLVSQSAEGAKFHDVALPNRQVLLAAAFFCDFDHSLAAEADDVYNIYAASQRAEDLCKKYLPRSLVDARFTTSVKTAIFIAKHRSDSNPRPITHRILRDANLMQPLERNEAHRVSHFLGLKKEVEQARRCTYKQAVFSSGMREFWKTQSRWLTEWGRCRAEYFDFAHVTSSLADTLSFTINADSQSA
jgi:hypothetical protein